MVQPSPEKSQGAHSISLGDATLPTKSSVSAVSYIINKDKQTVTSHSVSTHCPIVLKGINQSERNVFLSTNKQ